MVYPATAASKKYISREGNFEMLVADHAFLRNKQRFEKVYKTYGRFAEGQLEFFERAACEVCVKILDKGMIPDAKGILNMVRNNFIWAFDMSRGTPALVTLYPEKWENGDKGYDEFLKEGV